MLHFTILHYTILYFTYYSLLTTLVTLYFTLLYSTNLHYTLLCYAILYYAILYYTILYYTIISCFILQSVTKIVKLAPCFTLFHVDCKFACSCLKSGGRVNYCQASQVFFLGFFDKSKVNLSTGKFF